MKSYLLIGINYIGTRNELAGCINDTLAIQKVLLAHGADPANVIMMNELLADKSMHPTKSNMIRELSKMATSAKTGDSLFVHYSGHGSNTADRSGDEKDGRDEVFVPLDYDAVGGILDDEMFNILIRPLKTDVNLLVLTDCCHSGSILDLPCAYKFDKSIMGMDKTTEYRDTSNVSCARVVMISGCKDAQTSADTVFENLPCGAMTYAFTQAVAYLEARKKQLSCFKLVENMRAFLKMNNYDQVPELTSSFVLADNDAIKL